jgi:hypothetical protein
MKHADVDLHRRSDQEGSAFDCPQPMAKRCMAMIEGPRRLTLNEYTMHHADELRSALPWRTRTTRGLQRRASRARREKRRGAVRRARSTNRGP